MQFEGEFKVAGSPDEVIARFTDIERIARCIPGASIEGRDADGDYVGAMTVAFGPKQIRFKGKASCVFDLPKRSGVLKGWATADLRGSRMQVRTNFRVREDSGADLAAPLSIVSISSDAQLGGVLAGFAQTGGAVLADSLMAEFARRLGEEFANEGPPAAPPTPLSVQALLWSVCRSLWTGFARRFRRRG
jgi:hypothetical protein